MPRPELDWISVSGFKSIDELERLPLGPINVLIGANGAGKSNFIEVFHFLHAIRQGRLQEFVRRAGGANKVLHFGAKRTREARIRISFQDEVNQYEIQLQPTEQDQLVPTAESVYFWDKSRYPSPYSQRLAIQGKEAGISSTSEKIAGYVRSHLDRWRVYHFHDTSATSPIKQNQEILDNRFLRADGSNLAAFLYLLRRRNRESYDQIVRTIQMVAPFFRDFILEPLELNRNQIRLEWQHQDSDSYFDGSSLSDGTLRFISLATLFLQPAELRPSVIFVDEPELGLHPYAINLLASLVRQAAAKTQVIVSTCLIRRPR